MPLRDAILDKLDELSLHGDDHQARNLVKCIELFLVVSNKMDALANHGEDMTKHLETVRDGLAGIENQLHHLKQDISSTHHDPAFLLGGINLVESELRHKQDALRSMADAAQAQGTTIIAGTPASSPFMASPVKVGISCCTSFGLVFIALYFVFFDPMFIVLGLVTIVGSLGLLQFRHKECGGCHRRVPSSSKPGQRCPHCGVYWGTRKSRIDWKNPAGIP